jgi:hypothetical protein
MTIPVDDESVELVVERPPDVEPPPEPVITDVCPPVIAPPGVVEPPPLSGHAIDGTSMPGGDEGVGV